MVLPFDNASFLKAGQVMDIRQYPRAIKDQKLRVVMVLAFGENALPIKDQKLRVVMILAFRENARPTNQTEDDVHVLDIWLVVKIVTLSILSTPASLSTTSSGSPLEFLGGVNS
ncbi:hypothetical protein BGZ99_004213 [Dissophora globulifera]|uniref:Uncharacterized protein n=1 Tax=Dissophora globulifera TaxID=979702 RepID=A0A9P6RN52_9FUNG|nr:hypothetical protein BGZ99_004213 [Dissophora globulifera]